MIKIKNINRIEFLIIISSILLLKLIDVQYGILLNLPIFQNIIHTLLLISIFYVLAGRYQDMEKSIWNICWLLIPIFGPLIVIGQTLLLPSKFKLKRNYLEVK